MGDDKLMYVHPAPVRVWHWVNAVGFIILIITGIQIRFAEIVDWFSLEEAIQLHNYVGFVVIAVYGLWVSYYFGTMKINSTFPIRAPLCRMPLNSLNITAPGFSGESPTRTR
jgi:cytochrome b subunit of formate dehydrogenase